jgi:riboflavin-specific deaminase-like protein
MRLQRLYPRPGETTPEELISGLDLGSRAPADRPYLVLNMISSLDGKAAADGSTRAMGGEADRLLFHHLRTQADAIMVGATTAMTERYGRATKSEELRAKREREGLAPQPLMVLVSGRLSLTAELPLLQEPDARVMVATASEAEVEGAVAALDYLRTGDDLPLLMARLRSDHGVRSVLCEGGPTLNGHLLAAGLVDELMLTTTATIMGGALAPTIVAGRALTAPVPAELVSLHEGDGDLFARWRLQ